MIDVFSMTAPLIIRLPEGDEYIMAEKYPHADGLVFFEPFWLATGTPAVHVIKGEIKGDGPWKIGKAIVRVLSCGDMELSMQWSTWQQQLMILAGEYHDEQARLSLARQYGATV